MASQDIPFVTFVCAKDVHYGKALIGSLKWRYPDAEIHVVADTDTGTSDLAQMSRIGGVQIHRVSDLVARHGLNFRGLLSKFNVFFLAGVERALVVDSDSVLLDDVLSKIDVSRVYGSLHGRGVDLSDSVSLDSFERWAVRLDSLRMLGGEMPPGPVSFVSGSHFFLDVSRFPRELLARLVPLLGLTHEHDGPLRAGDQGFWNFVANFEPSLRHRTSVQGLTWDADAISPVMSERAAVAYLRDRRPATSPYSFIHYVGRSRRLLLSQHRYGEVLSTASAMYYTLLASRSARHVDFFRRLGAIGARRLRKGIGLQGK